MADIRGENMDIGDAGWWGVALAAIGGFLGWRIKTAQDSVSVAYLVEENKAMKERLRALENGSVTTATALATLSANIEGIGRTLSRMENKLDGKVDK